MQGLTVAWSESTSFVGQKNASLSSMPPKLEVIDDVSPLLLNKPKKSFDSLSTEEKKAFLDRITNESDPALNQALASMNNRSSDLVSVTIQPRPGFVCKTRIVGSSDKRKHPIDSKVYINICTSDKIPAPPFATETEIQQALNAEPNATYQVPLSMGQPRKDDEGKNMIVDACIHTDPYTRALRNLDFRLYILELAMEHVEEKESVQLSREFTMPNIESKGAIPKRILQLPKPSLAVQIKEETRSKKETEWVCKPEISIVGDRQLKVVVSMPSDDVKSWTVDVESSRITLNTNIQIALPSEVNVHETSSCEFFKKSRHLVIFLTLQAVRQRYL